MAGNSSKTTEVKKPKREVPEQLKKHTFKPGQSGNPNGRPKNVMKDFMRSEFKKMSDTEKRKFLRGIDGIDKWKMTEGNPHSTTDITSDDKPIPLFGPDVHTDDSNKKDKKSK